MRLAIIIIDANGVAGGPLPLLLFQQRRAEPPHIHIKAAQNEAKFWIDRIGLASNYGFRARELNDIEEIIRQHHTQLMEAGYEYFSEERP